MGTEASPRGRLIVFLGSAPGGGKTTAMLEEDTRLIDAGSDVVVALVESHGRTGVEALSAGFEQVPLRRLSCHNVQFDELDVDGVLRRDPQVALVDELAHTNVPGCRHEKRWQDVDELLSAGIDVVTSMNVSPKRFHDSVRQCLRTPIPEQRL